jgi:hypothetical protein
MCQKIVTLVSQYLMSLEIYFNNSEKNTNRLINLKICWLMSSFMGFYLPQCSS